MVMCTDNLLFTSVMIYWQDFYRRGHASTQVFQHHLRIGTNDCVTGLSTSMPASMQVLTYIDCADYSPEKLGGTWSSKYAGHGT